MPISPQALTRPAAAAEEVIDVAEQEALVGSARQGGGDLPFHRWGEDLIGIEKQHPLGAGRVTPQEPVALLGEVAGPVRRQSRQRLHRCSPNRSPPPAGRNQCRWPADRRPGCALHCALGWRWSDRARQQ